MGVSLLLLRIACAHAVVLGPAARVPHAAVPRSTPMCMSGESRRSVLFGGLLALAPACASAQVESVNPANNYYFPMAKYRYLPRIFRSWIAVDQLAPKALADKDWDGLREVWRRLDDSTTAMPLYTNAVEGSRSGKRKKKTDTQKAMKSDVAVYTDACKDLLVAIDKKDAKKASAALDKAKTSLLDYRQYAQIDTPDGGVIELPTGNAFEAGHGGAPLGYVVPAFRGGGISNDYSLEKGVPMLKGGVITQEFRAAGGASSLLQQ